MPLREFTGEQVAVNRIRSRYNTLNRYRKESMQAHGYLLESVGQLAKAVLEEVNSIREAYPDSVSVAKWATKTEEFVEQYGLT